MRKSTTSTAARERPDARFKALRRGIARSLAYQSSSNSSPRTPPPRRAIIHPTNAITPRQSLSPPSFTANGAFASRQSASKFKFKFQILTHLLGRPSTFRASPRRSSDLPARDARTARKSVNHSRVSRSFVATTHPSPNARGASRSPFECGRDAPASRCVALFIAFRLPDALARPLDRAPDFFFVFRGDGGDGDRPRAGFVARRARATIFVRRELRTTASLRGPFDKCFKSARHCAHTRVSDDVPRAESTSRRVAARPRDTATREGESERGPASRASSSRRRDRPTREAIWRARAMTRAKTR